MNNELHIQIKPEVPDAAEEILDGFPFEEGQSIVSYAGGVVIVDLAGQEDTSISQDWFLEDQEDVLSFFVLGE